MEGINKFHAEKCKFIIKRNTSQNVEVNKMGLESLLDKLNGKSKLTEQVQAISSPRIIKLDLGAILGENDAIKELGLGSKALLTNIEQSGTSIVLRIEEGEVSEG